VETLFAPWRLEYLTAADSRDRSVCIFCRAHASDDDRATLTLWRRSRSFALLNLYPYTTGHSMIAPVNHCSDLSELDDETTAEMMRGARILMEVLRELYKPHGFNVGFNVGEAAGAGIEEHLHLHVVPRWRADNNLMGVVGGTRVIPENLETTFDRMVEAITRSEGGRQQ